MADHMDSCINREHYHRTRSLERIFRIYFVDNRVCSRTYSSARVQLCHGTFSVILGFCTFFRCIYGISSLWPHWDLNKTRIFGNTFDSIHSPEHIGRTCSADIHRCNRMYSVHKALVVSTFSRISEGNRVVSSIWLLDKLALALDQSNRTTFQMRRCIGVSSAKHMTWNNRLLSHIRCTHLDRGLHDKRRHPVHICLGTPLMHFEDFRMYL